jgi:uncharacterized integral membrane protein
MPAWPWGESDPGINKPKRKYYAYQILIQILEIMQSLVMLFLLVMMVISTSSTVFQEILSDSEFPAAVIFFRGVD